MANSSEDVDDDFSEIYKEYTGPPRSTTYTNKDRIQTDKRSQAGSVEEEEDCDRDPNAVPTDFTSREAKVWEAKSKATERNWKKRKEEEMICKICGESGHFTQGCPSTLGANRKSQDFFERVPAREHRVKELFTEKVVRNIEKDIGCQVKIGEKFIIVSGKDRLILAKGVDAVHKIKEEGNKKGFSSPQAARSRSPEQSPAVFRSERSESQRSFPSPQNASQLPKRLGQHEKVVEDHVREGLHKWARGSLQAYGKDGGRGRSNHSESPAYLHYKDKFFSSYANHKNMGVYRTDERGVKGRSSHSESPTRHHYMESSSDPYASHKQITGVYRTDERGGSDIQYGHKFEYSASPGSLEEIELEFQREEMALGRIRDREEDEENYKHRETLREMRESYMKKLAILRGMHAKQWEEFVQLDVQRQQHAHQQMSTSRFVGYKQPGHEYGSSETNGLYSATNLSMDSRGSYVNTTENHPLSVPHDNYGDFQSRRQDDFGKAYNRY